MQLRQQLDWLEQLHHRASSRQQHPSNEPQQQAPPALMVRTLTMAVAVTDSHSMTTVLASTTAEVLVASVGGNISSSSHGLPIAAAKLPQTTACCKL